MSAIGLMATEHFRGLLLGTKGVPAGGGRQSLAKGASIRASTAAAAAAADAALAALESGSDSEGMLLT